MGWQGINIWPAKQVSLEHGRQPREALLVVEKVSCGQGTQENMFGALPSKDVKDAGQGSVDDFIAA